MAKSCSEGFVSVPKEERKGVTIGVLSGHTRGYSIPGYPNEYTEVKVYMKAPDVKVGEHKVTTRNHANEADLVIALPGDSQTRNEVRRTYISVREQKGHMYAFTPPSAIGAAHKHRRLQARVRNPSLKQWIPSQREQTRRPASCRSSRSSHS